MHNFLPKLLYLSPMKYLLLLLGFSFVLSATQAGMPAPEQPSKIATEANTWQDYAALSTAVVGAILLPLPFVSIPGLILCAAGLGLGIFRRKKRKHWSNLLAIIVGSLGIAYFLAALGLIVLY